MLNKECAYCGKTIEVGETYYQVMIYEKDGTQVFEPTCSERCANLITNLPIAIHRGMVDSMKNQGVQKMVL